MAITEPERILVSDRDIAGFLSISKSWVRKERFCRRHGLKHTLTLDPVMIGRSPRYRLAEIRAWLEQQAAKTGEASDA